MWISTTTYKGISFLRWILCRVQGKVSCRQKERRHCSRFAGGFSGENILEIKYFGIELGKVFSFVFKCIKIKQIIDEDIPTKIETLSKADADALCNRLAQNFDFTHYDEEVRIVTVGGWPCPCGGTHVRSTGDLKERGWKVVGECIFI